MGVAKYMQGLPWLWPKLDSNNVIAAEPTLKVNLIIRYRLDLSCKAVFSAVVRCVWAKSCTSFSCCVSFFFTVLPLIQLFFLLSFMKESFDWILLLIISHKIKVD